MTGRPESNEYAAWYAAYINNTTENDCIMALQHAAAQLSDIEPLLAEVAADFSYAPGKWSVAVLLQHLADSEWIFCTRALRFARCDRTPLPGYDHDQYAESPVNTDVPGLISQLKVLRSATIGLFSGFNQDMMLASGMANGHEVSVRALGFIIAGHQIHHVNVLKNRYLNQ